MAVSPARAAAFAILLRVEREDSYAAELLHSEPLAALSSRDHGLANIDALVAEWSKRFPIPEETIRSYLTTNIHYVLDEECLEGMRGFFRAAAECGILPQYDVRVEELARR